MSKKALVVWGGWDGHHPKEVGEIFARVLKEEGFEVELSNTLDAFNDAAALKNLSLIVPHWTMGKISGEQCKAVMEAVQGGVGLAGCHGGMCDAFRENSDWQFMTGGQFVAHPGAPNKYTVKITAKKDPLVAEIADFDLVSEQYYMHVDPAVKVLATTRFPTVDGPHAPNGPVDMPVVWTKLWGQGRVYYNSLGHDGAIVSMPPVLEMMRRGFKWAAK